MKHTDRFDYRLWAKRRKDVEMAIVYNKLSKELLLEAATVLKRWSKEHHTSGHQHEPMAVLSKKIFIHLNTPNQAMHTDMDWHRPSVDKFENVECLQCGKLQAPSFTACIYCCPHEILCFDEEWDQGWKLSVYCEACGKNFDFTNKYLINKYKAVKKQITSENNKMRETT